MHALPNAKKARDLLMYVEDIISTAEMMKFSALSLMTPPEIFGLHTFW